MDLVQNQWHLSIDALSPPRESRYKDYAEIQRTVSAGPYSYSSECKDGIPLALETRRMAKESNLLALQIESIEQGSLFYRLGLRSGDILRIAEPTQQQRIDWSAGRIPELCDGKPSELLVERGGRFNSMKLEFPVSDSSREPMDPTDGRGLPQEFRFTSWTRPVYEPAIDPLSPAHEDNPINPETGERFTDTQMAKFDSLREKFPDNDILPVRQSPEDRSRKELEIKRIYSLQAKIVKKEASCQEVNEYYDYQIRSARDRIELVEFALQKKETTADMGSKLKQILDMNRRTLISYEQARNRALKHCAGNPGALQ